MINYRSRKGYKNLRIGFTRTVVAWENQTYNFTLYVNDYMFDFTVWPWNLSVSLHKFS